VKNIQIALDGPSGAGKSTMARHVANMLKILYLDTGAMYRALALKCIRNGIETKQMNSVYSLMLDTTIDVMYIDGGQHMFLDGKDVTMEIRTNEVSMGASNVSAHQNVREKMVAMQQNIAANKNVIMDGRDIGTKVLPNAPIKIFLTATSEDRARRRFLELQAKGDHSKIFEDVLEELKERDWNDTHRKHSPLKQASDAICVDTTDLSLEAATDKIVSIIKDKINSMI